MRFFVFHARCGVTSGYLWKVNGCCKGSWGRIVSDRDIGVMAGAGTLSSHAGLYNENGCKVAFAAGTYLSGVETVLRHNSIVDTEG